MAPATRKAQLWREMQRAEQVLWMLGSSWELGLLLPCLCRHVEPVCVGVPAAAQQGLESSCEETRAGVPWLTAPSTGCTSLQNSYPCLSQGFAASHLAAVDLQGFTEQWKGVTAAQHWLNTVTCKEFRFV